MKDATKESKKWTDTYTMKINKTISPDMFSYKTEVKICK